MDFKHLLRLQDLPHRVTVPRRVFVLLAAMVPVLILAFLLFGLSAFVQYEFERLAQPVFAEHAVPTLKRDDLRRFVRRLQVIPQAPSLPSPPPSPQSHAPASIQLAP